MDEVWMLSLCLILFAFFIFILSLTTKKEKEPESIIKPSESISSYSSYGGKSLECSEEEIDHMMERLNKLMFEAKKEDVSHEKRKLVIHEKDEEGTHYRRDAENANETQEFCGKGPAHTQPAYQPSHHRFQERSASAGGVENIMDEIEQAVQETVEPDYYSRRRQQQAGSRARQWSDISGRQDTDGM